MSAMKRTKVAQSLPEGCCALCKSSEDDSSRFGEKRTVEDVTIHYFCALFASGLHQNGDRDTEGIWGFLLSDIKSEAKRARRLTCAFCKQSGASVGCFVRTCPAAFHFPCGLRNDVLNQYTGSFSSYCQKHRPCQEVPKTTSSKCGVTSCAICLCDVEAKPSVNVLLVPCCQNSYIHRECVQQMALSSGLHFFKCPLCNNRELFSKEMLKFGVYIPDRDALWEQEANAFGDLLERHCSCDVLNCVCEFGRDFNEIDSCWEIMLCDSCGSEGTHLACSSLKTAMDDWMCCSCNSVFVKVSKRRKVKARRKKKSASCSRSSHFSFGLDHQIPHFKEEMPEHENLQSQSRSTVPSVSASDVSDQSFDSSYKPRPRRLSRYVLRHKIVRGAVPENPPRWVKNLLNDDIHTGRNLGAKLSYMHTSTAESELQE